MWKIAVGIYILYMEHKNENSIVTNMLTMILVLIEICFYYRVHLILVRIGLPQVKKIVSLIVVLINTFNFLS